MELFKDGDTITHAELTEALRHVQIAFGQYGTPLKIAAYPEALARDLFRHAADHREPEYEVGKVYQSANGIYYLRSSAGDWTLFSGRHVPHDVPKRPLRKLVPEPTP